LSSLECVSNQYTSAGKSLSGSNVLWQRYVLILIPLKQQAHLMKLRYSIAGSLSRLPRLFAVGLGLIFCLPGNVQAQMPANLDLASGNFTNWKCWVGISDRGTLATGTSFTQGVVSSPIGGNAPNPNNGNKSRHAITSGSDTDYYGGFPIVCPSGGSYSLRLGNDSIDLRADRVQYLVHVPATSISYNIQAQLAAVLQDGSHMPDEQSTFHVIAYDSATGAVIPSANNMYIAKWAIPGFSPHVEPVTGRVDSSIAWLPWTPTTINLSGMGGKTVVVEVTAIDCMFSGHWAYGYFDVISAVDSLAPSMLGYNTAGDSVVLQGPPGYMSYRWYNQNFSVAFTGPSDTARTRTLVAPTTPQYYNLVITPYSSIGVADTIRTSVLKTRGLGVSNEILAAVRVYPTPSTTTLHIAFPSIFEGTVNLFNATGESVYSKRLVNSASYEIETAAFATGIYTMVLQDAKGGSEVRQVSIKH
jgi:hypothetical protein